MAFTAHYDSINLQNDQFIVVITFNDSATGFTSTKTYNFATNTLLATAVALITADGNAYKSSLTAFNNLQAKVGTSITI